MNVRDLLLTPVLIFIVYKVAQQVRPAIATPASSPYFMPALFTKLFGAIALGLIYQFYYSGGDTFNFFYQAGLLIDLFMDDPISFFEVLFTGNSETGYTARYIPYMYWWNAPTEMFVVRLTAFLGLFTFHTYSATALLFALYSFSGSWAMYRTFLRMFPGLERSMAIAIFFIPSVFFWGSGILKDTLGLGALGWLVYAFYNLFIAKRNITRSVAMGLIAIWIIASIRMYLLLSFMPPALFWVVLENNNLIRNKFIRFAVKPMFLILAVAGAYIGTLVTKGHNRYDIDRVGQLTKVNAEYLYQTSVKEGGSAYYLGELDGSVGSMLRLAPQALVVSLFRPFIWEARNPVMLLSALESMFMLFLLIRVVWRTGLYSFMQLVATRPFLLFCISFTVIFGVAVGLNSFNFGSLVRYKIPLIPMFVGALLMMEEYVRLRSQFARQATIR